MFLDDGQADEYCDTIDGFLFLVATPVYFIFLFFPISLDLSPVS